MQNRIAELIVVGELNVDLILNRIAGFPEIGKEILADDMNITLGSSAAIFAANISTLGTNTSFCGMVGDDSFGKFIRNELEKKIIRTNLVKTSAIDKTGITISMNYGENRANVTYAGAMETFSKVDLPDDLSAFSHLHLSSYFLMKGLKPAVPSLFKRAREMGITTSLDLQWDPENKWNFPLEDCLPYVDIFLPNESEILMLTASDSLDEAAAKLLPISRTIVVKRGREGAVAFHNGNRITVAPFLHNHFVDAIGAGDSFNAGFIHQYLNGADLPTCLKVASLCGAINTTSIGGTTAFESLEMVTKTAKLLFNTDFII